MFGVYGRGARPRARAETAFETPSFGSAPLGARTTHQHHMGACASAPDREPIVKLSKKQEQEIIDVLALDKADLARLRRDRDDLRNALGHTVDENERLHRENAMLRGQAWAPTPMTPAGLSRTVDVTAAGDAGVAGAPDIELMSLAATAATSAAEAVRQLSNLAKGSRPGSASRTAQTSREPSTPRPTASYSQAINTVEHWCRELLRVAHSSPPPTPTEPVTPTRVVKDIERLNLDWEMLHESLARASATTGASLMLLESAIRSAMATDEDTSTLSPEARDELAQAASVTVSSLSALLALAKRSDRFIHTAAAQVYADDAGKLALVAPRSASGTGSSGAAATSVAPQSGGSELRQSV